MEQTVVKMAYLHSSEWPSELPAVTFGQTTWCGLFVGLLVYADHSDWKLYLFANFLGEFYHHIHTCGLHYNQDFMEMLENGTFSPNTMSDNQS